MDELLKALTRAALAVAAYYEKQANPLVSAPGKTCDKPCGENVRETPAPKVALKPAASAPEPVLAEPAASAAPAPAKRGRPKKAAAAEAPAAPAELLIDKEYELLTDDESAKRIFEVGEALIGKFPALAAPGPDGEPAPEGFHMLVSVLKESFKVDRVTKLSPRQRLQFMTIVKAKLSQAAPASASTGEDPNLGV